MKVAVVILNWNGKSLLKQFLPSVVKHSPEAEIYVADNASSDDSIGFLKKNFPQVRLIQNKFNGGFAKGYNDALEHVKEEIFVLLNSDVEVTPGWLEPLIEIFDQNDDVAAVQPKILDFRKRTHFEYAGAAGGFIDALGYPYCRGRIFDTLERDEHQYDDTTQVFWATGACMGIRRKDFFDAGGFDEDFFAHQEEIDLCWRLFNRNRKVMAAGNSVVYHLGGGTLNNMHPKKTFLNFRNSLFTLVKNAPKKGLPQKIILRLLLDGVAGMRLLLLLQPSHTLAILKAHFDFYKNLRKMWQKRLKIQNKEKYYTEFTVVGAYYLKGNKKFTKL
ncbi:glycosyltransferase family 2 protein [Salinimicrobium oceani]|uniref:Glycosyltransferase family 2 protein n=1 Tax=Salinimicrobium oceani TaxID=2722702 RepID=A0ABX1CSY1_9FLAO|nr:glycosyltransferase family 2 protein [Salinimicrobium oceani]NJW51409.1 glycosyltransferase family 2 protein [Salinimicrobium oceani]